jgi:DNA mismatch repair protein MutH
MSHFLTNDDEYRDLIYGDDYRSYLMARSKSLDGYQFGRIQGKRVRVHAPHTLGRVKGYLKGMIEAIADTKLRRMERELELRGIRFERSNESWAARKSHPTER